MKKIFLLSLIIPACFASCSKNIISGDMDVDIEIQETDFFTGDVVQFKALTCGTVARYDWTFEGGTPATSPLSCPSVQWLDAGNYTVSLTVSNKNGSASVTKKKIITIDYSRNIKADFEVDRTSATNAEDIQFTSLSTGYPTSFLWTFSSDTGNTVTSTEQNPCIKLDPGTYSVTLKAYNPVTSDTAMKSGVILVIDKDAVIARFDKDRNVILENGFVKFSDKSLGVGEDWYWEFEGGVPSTSTEINPVVQYKTAGEYSVRLTVRNKISESEVTETSCVKVVTVNGLVFFLPFDGDIKDLGPNAYNASYYTLGAAACTFTDGHGPFSSQAVTMPGGNKSKCSVIQLPADNWQSMFPQGSDMTLCMWVKVGAFSAGQIGFFAMGSCPGVLEEGNNQIWARMQTSGVMRMLVESYQGAGNDIQVDNQWLDDKWHHYAFVYSSSGSDKKDAYMYIDGKLVGSSLGKPNKAIDTKPFFLGTNMRMTSGVWAPESCILGSIDDVFLYNRALSESEIVKLSNY